jgi:Flp pilus assembly protein CpaB
VLGAFDTGDLESGGSRRAALVAQGARVLATDDAASDDAESAGDAEPGVTLLVTEAEAGAVAYAASYGSITIALAPPEAACCPSPRRSSEP